MGDFKFDPLSGDACEELVLLSRQETLETIYELLCEGRVRDATRLSRLLDAAPTLIASDDVISDALEAALRGLVDRREYSEGVRRFESREPVETPSVEAERLAGICYGWCGQHEEARHHLLRSRSRGSHQATLDLAALERRAMRFTNSADLLERTSAAMSETDESRRLMLEEQLAETHQWLGRFEQARQMHLRMLERLDGERENGPHQLRAFGSLVALEFSEARFARALDYADRALRASLDTDGTVLPTLYRALSLACLGRDEEARAAFEAMPATGQLDPAGQAMDLNLRGLFAWLQGDQDRARELLLAVVEIAARHGLRHALFLVAGQLVLLHHQLSNFEEVRRWRDRLKALLEPGLSGPRLERLSKLADAYLHLAEGRADFALELLGRHAPRANAPEEPPESLLDLLIEAEASLALGRIERGRRALLAILDWWEGHERTPLVALVMGGTPRAVTFCQVYGDPVLEKLHAHFTARYGAPLENIRLITLTPHPELRFGERPVPLANQHVVPLLTYLHARGPRGATVAEIGRDLFPELRGERLRNRVKNARVELREAVEAARRADPADFGRLASLRVASEGNTRSMTLRLETGDHTTRWDLEEMERALDAGASDWVWLLTAYHGDFLEGYDPEGDEGWVQATRERLRAKLLERAASLVAKWFAQGRLEQVRSLVRAFLARGIFDPISPLTDLIAAYEVRAVGTLAGREASLAVWTAHDARFRAAFVDAPELEAAHPNRREGP